MGRQRKFTPWLAGITALVALAILLFPVYAVIVGSFENSASLTCFLRASALGFRH